MFLRDPIRRRRHRDLAIMMIGALTAAAPRLLRLPAGHRQRTRRSTHRRRRSSPTGCRTGRGRASPCPHNRDGLVAVVSDTPEALRAKRRDLEAHDHTIETPPASPTSTAAGKFTSTWSSCDRFLNPGGSGGASLSKPDPAARRRA